MTAADGTRFIVLLASLMSTNLKADLYHHGLLRRPLLEGRSAEERRSYGSSALPLLDFQPSENGVVQLVWVRVSRNVFHNEASWRPDGGLVWTKLGSDSRQPKQMMHSGEDEPQHRKFPLVDVPVSLTRIVVGLSNLLRWASKSRAGGSWDFSKGIASSFALGLPKSDTLSCGVGPLSTELFLNNGTNDVRLQGLKPGQWAIVLIHNYFDALFDGPDSDNQQNGVLRAFPMKKQVRTFIPSSFHQLPFFYEDTHLSPSNHLLCSIPAGNLENTQLINAESIRSITSLSVRPRTPQITSSSPMSRNSCA